ncbi:hypothetical protein HGH93_19310 [Chitinophaga polysaccharea]|uniref:hypothetical protein n=1 Tax=Chitinophaga polysaccharea TaxID=1293035 RepID=UPI001455BBAD|nr:hypothetical protein [Chitinophaga polysaccharea]NLR60268.1 hypothetical protein [Chitinophaga polysaccharea]
MKEQHFSFRPYHSILLFFIFAGAMYTLYWYLVPNLNYEIPEMVFVVLFLGGIGWYCYDAFFKSNSVCYLDIYPECFLTQNLQRQATYYYYRDIADIELLTYTSQQITAYRLTLLMKSGEKIPLKLELFSGKAIQSLAILVTERI